MSEHAWEVQVSGKARKQMKKLPQRVSAIADLLSRDLHVLGPELPLWPHYGKLVNKPSDLRHCHLTRTKPVYVAVWEVIDTEGRKILIREIGTHEGVNYDRIK
jgi:mRNA-degrading endonuclease YafQ of YafQ-DinJ toxin-antitoxin module